MNRRLRLLAAYTFLLPALALWSCGDNGVYPESKNNRQALTTENLQQLQNAEWQLYSFELVGGNSTQVPAEQLFTLVFQDTEATGRADVNTFSVPYEVDTSDNVRFLSIETSNVAIPPVSMSTRFYDALRDAELFTTTDSSLHLYYENATKVMNFRKRSYISLMSPELLQSYQWRLRSFEELGMWVADPTTVTTVPDNQIMTLVVRTSGEFSCRIDCNYYVGFYNGSPAMKAINTIRFTPYGLLILQDSVACGSGSMENAYRAAINTAQYYEVTDTSLHVYYDNNSKVLHFTRDTNSYAGAMTVESAVGTSWTLTAIQSPTTLYPIPDQTPFTLSITADSIYGQAYCATYAYRYTPFPSGFMTIEQIRPVNTVCGDSDEKRWSLYRFIDVLAYSKRFDFPDTNTLVIYTSATSTLFEGQQGRLVLTRQ